MRSPRRLLAVLLLVLAAVCGLLALPATDAGRQLLGRALGWLLSSPERTVQLEGLGPGLPGVVRLARLTVADADGVWLTAEDISLTPRWPELARGAIALERVQAARVRLERLPRQKRDTEPAPAASPPAPFPPLRLPSVEVASLELGPALAGAPVRAQVHGQARLEAASWEVRLDVQELPHGTRLAGQLAGSADELVVDLRLEEPAGGWIHRALGLTDLPASLTVTGRGPWQGWQGGLAVRLAGLLEATADLALADGDLRVTGRLAPGPERTTLGTAPMELAARAGWEAAGLRVSELRLAHPLASLTAQGMVDRTGRGAWNATLQARPTAEATVDWQGSVTHDRRGMALDGILQATALALELQAPGTLTLDWDGPWQAALEATVHHPAGPLAGRLEMRGPALAPAGTMALTLQAIPPLPEPLPRLLGQAPRLEARWRLAEGGVVLDPLRVEAPLAATGTVRLDPAGAAGELELRLPPRAWEAAPQGGRGRVQGRWEADTPRLDAQFQLPRLSLAGTELAGVAAAGSWQGQRLEATATATAQGIPVRLEAQAGLSAGEVRLRTAQVQAGATQLTATGTLRPGTGHGALSLRLRAPDLAALAAVLGQPLHGHLEADAALRRESRGWTGEAQAQGQVAGRGWASGQARLQARLDGQGLRGEVTLGSPRLGPWPADLVRLTLAGPPAALEGTLTAARGASTLQARLRLDDGRQLTVTDLAGSVLGHDLRQEAPLRLRWDGQDLAWEPWQVRLGPVALATSGRWGSAVDAGLRLQGSLAPIPGLLGLDGQRLDGQVDASLHLQGSGDQPQFTGQGRITDLRYAHLGLGLAVENGTARLDALPDAAGLRLTAAGQDPAGGTAQVEGHWRLDGQARMAASFQNFRLAHTDRLQVTATGPARLEVAGTPRLTADLVLTQVLVRLPRQLGGVPRLEVEEVPPRQGRPQAIVPPLGLDVRLRTAAPARLLGHGLDSLWQAEVTAAGLATAPVLHGELRLERGSWQFLGRRFELTQGRIQFPEPGRAFVDLSAQAAAPGIQTTARLLGPADALRLDLSSSPALPADEILARTLFGRSMRQISPLQALRLAQAAASLGAPGSASPGGQGLFQALDALEQHLGLGGLHIGVDDQDNPAVGLDQEIGGTQVRAERSLGSGDRTSVEVQITPNLGVRTEIGADSRQGAGLQWSMDY